MEALIDQLKGLLGKEGPKDVSTARRSLEVSFEQVVLAHW